MFSIHTNLHVRKTFSNEDTGRTRTHSAIFPVSCRGTTQGIHTLSPLQGTMPDQHSYHIVPSLRFVVFLVFVVSIKHEHDLAHASSVRHVCLNCEHIVRPLGGRGPKVVHFTGPLGNPLDTRNTRAWPEVFAQSGQCFTGVKRPEKGPGKRRCIRSPRQRLRSLPLLGRLRL